MGSEASPATSLLANDRQALQEVVASLPWETLSTDVAQQCIPSAPAHLAAAAAPVDARHAERNNALASGVAEGTEVLAGGQSHCTVQEMELSPLLSGVKATCGPYPVSFRRPKGSEHVVCGAAEVRGRREGANNSVSGLPLPLQGEDKIALACNDKWKMVRRFCTTNWVQHSMCVCMVITVGVYIIILYSFETTLASHNGTDVGVKSDVLNPIQESSSVIMIARRIPGWGQNV